MKAHQRQWFVEELLRITVIVYMERNAQHRPAKYRAQIKAEARPHLREAIHWARHTRNALNTGDLATTQRLYERAVTSFVLALAVLGAPYIQQGLRRSAGLASLSERGGAATAEAHALPELDDLIRSCLERGERTRDYTKEWADEFNITASTVRRHIKRIKAKLAAG